MGQLGFPEMLAILIVALLVFGPKKLPELGQSLGKGLREFRKATNELKSSWEDQIKEAEHSIADVKKSVEETTREINTEIRRGTKPEIAETAPLTEAPGEEVSAEPTMSPEQKS